MEFFKTQFSKIQQQLSGLSASQKMLTASLVAIMVMTLVWWSHYAADPEMISLLGESALAVNDIGQITAHLDGKGVAYKVVGDKIMVPADRKMAIFADLTYSQAMPRDIKTPLDDILKEITPFTSPGITDRMMLEVKQRTLQMVIGNFPGVANAIVVIDPTNERRFDNTAVQSSATVMITTRRDGTASQKTLANAAANVIAGAQAGLARSRISIVIDGTSYSVHDKDEDNNFEDGSMVDALRQNEAHYADKIRDELKFINGLMVSVTVKLNTASTTKIIHDVDPKNFIQKELHTEEHNEDSTAASGGGEAGTVPNTGLSVGSGASGGNTTNSTDTKTDFHVDNGHTDTTVHNGPGDVTVLAATVRVPRSYFVQTFKNKNHNDPDDAMLDVYSTEELKTIKNDVRTCTGITNLDDIAVASYNDAMPPEPANTMQTPSAPVSVMVGSHSKEIGVGVLAAISLFMVSMMVRKGTPAPVLAAPIESSEPTQLRTVEELAGEVGEGGAMLDGMELDEDTVKTQQMLDQVQQMVTENPDAAANLVKRWLNRT